MRQHPRRGPSTPGKSWEGVHCGCAQRRRGSASGTRSHQDLACLTVHAAEPKSIFSAALLEKLSHGATQGARAPGPHSLPLPLAPAAPSHLASTVRFLAPLHRDRHRDAAHHPHPDPRWNVPGRGGCGGCGWVPGGSLHREPRQTFHQLQPCPHPTRLPGPHARFPGRGTGSEPTTAVCRPGGGGGAAPGQKLSLRLFFPVNPHEGSQQRPGSGAVRAHEIFRGQSF